MAAVRMELSPCGDANLELRIQQLREHEPHVIRRNLGRPTIRRIFGHGRQIPSRDLVAAHEDRPGSSFEHSRAPCRGSYSSQRSARAEGRKRKEQTEETADALLDDQRRHAIERVRVSLLQRFELSLGYSAPICRRIPSVALSVEGNQQISGRLFRVVQLGGARNFSRSTFGPQFTTMGLFAPTVKPELSRTADNSAGPG